jgi:hypothetical protein
MATLRTIAQDSGAKLSTFRVKINRKIESGKFSQEVAAELTGISSDTELSDHAVAEITAMPKNARGQAKPAGPNADELQADLLSARLELAELKAIIEGFEATDKMQRQQIKQLNADLERESLRVIVYEKEASNLQLALNNLQTASDERLAYMMRTEGTYKDKVSELSSMMRESAQENDRITSELQTLQNELSTKTNELTTLQGEVARRKADTGRALLEAPNVRFLTALVPIIAQAVMYALLACKVFSIQAEWYYIAPLVVIGVLFEASGLMLSMSVPSTSTITIGGDKVKTRGLWLATFFLVQVLIDFAYAGMLGSWSDVIGKTLISFSIPLTILAYNNLYLKE